MLEEANIFPPRIADLLFQVVTIPPAFSIIGISGTMSKGLRLVSITASTFPSASKQKFKASNVATPKYAAVEITFLIFLLYFFLNNISCKCPITLHFLKLLSFEVFKIVFLLLIK